MRAIHVLALVLAVVLSGVALTQGEEAPGIAVGAKAPVLKGSKWLTKDGKAPDLKEKVYLVDFWFAA